jgi:hypothetical protein
MQALASFIVEAGIQDNGPLSATVEKQNCGVSFGGGAGCAIMPGELDASAPEDFDHRKLARVKRADRMSVLLL